MTLEAPAALWLMPHHFIASRKKNYHRNSNGIIANTGLNGDGNSLYSPVIQWRGGGGGLDAQNKPSVSLNKIQPTSANSITKWKEEFH